MPEPFAEAAITNQAAGITTAVVPSVDANKDDVSDFLQTLKTPGMDAINSMPVAITNEVNTTVAGKVELSDFLQSLQMPDGDELSELMQDTNTSVPPKMALQSTPTEDNVSVIPASHGSSLPPTSAPSVTAKKTCCAPGVPQDLRAMVEDTIAGTSKAAVVWQAPKIDGGSPITAYYVSDLLEKHTVWVRGEAGQAPPTTYTMTGLESGHVYAFYVKAVNEFGESEKSSPSLPVTIPEACCAPGIPTSVQATANDAMVTVSWKVPALDGGAAIVGYAVKTVAASLSDNTPATINHYWKVEGNPPPTATIITGLTNGKAYSFVVTALNHYGEGKQSPPSPPVTPFHSTNLCEHTSCSGHGTCYPQYGETLVATSAPSAVPSASPTSVSAYATSSAPATDAPSAEESSNLIDGSSQVSGALPPSELSFAEEVALELRGLAKCACWPGYRTSDDCSTMIHHQVLGAPVGWDVGPWGKCSEGCGGGLQRRKVSCALFEKDKTTFDLPKSNITLCSERTPMPPTTTECNTLPCGSEYIRVSLVLDLNMRYVSFSEEAQTGFYNSFVAEVSAALSLPRDQIKIMSMSSHKDHETSSGMSKHASMLEEARQQHLESNSGQTYHADKNSKLHSHYTYIDIAIRPRASPPPSTFPPTRQPTLHKTASGYHSSGFMLSRYAGAAGANMTQPMNLSTHNNRTKVDIMSHQYNSNTTTHPDSDTHALRAGALNLTTPLSEPTAPESQGLSDLAAKNVELKMDMDLASSMSEGGAPMSVLVADVEGQVSQLKKNLLHQGTWGRLTIEGMMSAELVTANELNLLSTDPCAGMTCSGHGTCFPMYGMADSDYIMPDDGDVYLSASGAGSLWTGLTEKLFAIHSPAGKGLAGEDFQKDRHGGVSIEDAADEKMKGGGGKGGGRRLVVGRGRRRKGGRRLGAAAGDAGQAAKTAPEPIDIGALYIGSAADPVPEFNAKTDGNGANQRCVCRFGYGEHNCSSLVGTSLTYGWWAGEWGECPVGCGGGLRRRSVRCEEFNDGVFSTIALDGQCESLHKPKPAERDVCNAMACGSDYGLVRMGLDFPFQDIFYRAEGVEAFVGSFLYELTTALGVSETRVEIVAVESAMSDETENGVGSGHPKSIVMVEMQLLPEGYSERGNDNDDDNEEGLDVPMLLQQLKTQVQSLSSRFRSFGTWGRRVMASQLWANITRAEPYSTDGDSFAFASMVAHGTAGVYGGVRYAGGLSALGDRVDLCRTVECSGHGTCIPDYSWRSGVSQRTQQQQQHASSSSISNGIGSRRSAMASGKAGPGGDTKVNGHASGIARCFCNPGYMVEPTGDVDGGISSSGKALASDCSVSHSGLFYNWEANVWKDCSLGCGGGTRVRSVTCGVYSAEPEEEKGGVDFSGKGVQATAQRKWRFVKTLGEDDTEEDQSGKDTETCSQFSVKPEDSQRCNMLKCQEEYANAMLELTLDYKRIAFSISVLSAFELSFRTEIALALGIPESRISIIGTTPTPPGGGISGTVKKDTPGTQVRFSIAPHLHATHVEAPSQGGGMSQIFKSNIRQSTSSSAVGGAGGGLHTTAKDGGSGGEGGGDNAWEQLSAAQLLTELKAMVENVTSPLRTTGTWGRLIEESASKGAVLTAEAASAVPTQAVSLVGVEITVLVRSMLR
jgi:hypothetical protein